MSLNEKQSALISGVAEALVKAFNSVELSGVEPPKVGNPTSQKYLGSSDEEDESEIVLLAQNNELKPNLVKGLEPLTHKTESVLITMAKYLQVLYDRLVDQHRSYTFGIKPLFDEPTPPGSLVFFNGQANPHHWKEPSPLRGKFMRSLSVLYLENIRYISYEATRTIEFALRNFAQSQEYCIKYTADHGISTVTKVATLRATSRECKCIYILYWQVDGLIKKLVQDLLSPTMIKEF